MKTVVGCLVVGMLLAGITLAPAVGQDGCANCAKARVYVQAAPPMPYAAASVGCSGGYARASAGCSGYSRASAGCSGRARLMRRGAERRQSRRDARAYARGCGG